MKGERCKFWGGVKERRKLRVRKTRKQELDLGCEMEGKSGAVDVENGKQKQYSTASVMLGSDGVRTIDYPLCLGTYLLRLVLP